jgi:hypothetical protein
LVQAAVVGLPVLKEATETTQFFQLLQQPAAVVVQVIHLIPTAIAVVQAVVVQNPAELVVPAQQIKVSKAVMSQAIHTAQAVVVQVLLALTRRRLVLVRLAAMVSLLQFQVLLSLTQAAVAAVVTQATHLHLVVQAAVVSVVLMR